MSEQFIEFGPIENGASSTFGDALNGRLDALKIAANKAIRGGDAWSNLVTYFPQDLVTSGGKTWRAKTESTNSMPVESADWTIFGSGDGAIADNSITNAKIAAGVDAAKIGTGAVSNSEFAYLDGVTSSIQGQLNGKASSGDVGALAGVISDEIAAREAADTALQEQIGNFDAGDVFTAGDNITITDNGDGTKEIAAIGDLTPSLSRANASITTTALANGATDSTQTVALGRSAIVSRVQSSRAAWVRVYVSAAHMAADAARDFEDYATGEHGLVLEVVLTDANLTYDLAPLAVASNLESPPVADYPVSVKSLASGTATTTVTFTKITLEI